jgi:hypothetical protein
VFRTSTWREYACVPRRKDIPVLSCFIAPPGMRPAPPNRDSSSASLRLCERTGLFGSAFAFLLRPLRLLRCLNSDAFAQVRQELAVPLVFATLDAIAPPAPSTPTAMKSNLAQSISAQFRAPAGRDTAYFHPEGVLP